MIDPKSYFSLSEKAKRFTSEYLSSELLKDNFLELTVEEQKSVLNHYISDGRAAALKDRPLLYDQIISYMADIAHVPVSHVKVIGSFKVGFCTGLEFGRPFGPDRDIDITIFDKNLFMMLESEYKAWKTAYGNGSCEPQNMYERKCWDDNINVIKQKAKQGFIDTYRIPNRNMCPTVKELHNAAFIIEYKLYEYHNIRIKKSGVSIRVYKTYEDYIKTLLYNTKNILEKANSK